MGAQQSRTTAKTVGLKLRARLRKNHSDSLLTSSSQMTVSTSEGGHKVDQKFSSCSDLNAHGADDANDILPEACIRAYKTHRQRVMCWSGTHEDYLRLRGELQASTRELDDCEVREVRESLRAKYLRLLAMLEEKHDNEDVDVEMAGEGGSGDDDDGAGGLRAACAQLGDSVHAIKMFELFMGFTCRLEKLKLRMVEYYGDDKHEEYKAIVDELQSVLDAVRAIKDNGDLRTIVTREEYEDYILEQAERFRRLVEINKLQKRTSIFSGGTARSSRVLRSTKFN